MRRTRRAISLVASLVLVMAAFVPAMAFADDSDTIKVTFDDGTTATATAEDSPAAVGHFWVSGPLDGTAVSAEAKIDGESYEWDGDHGSEHASLECEAGQTAHWHFVLNAAGFLVLSGSECRGEPDTPTEGELEDLQLTYMQECPDVDKVRWRVTNPNDEAVDFDWDVYGTDIGGTATVDAKGTYFIELANDGTSRTVRILDGDKVIDTKAGGDTFKDADHPDCVVAHEDLQLTYMQECPDVDKVRWRVTNPNDEAVDFDWDVYGTDIGGTATVDAKGTYFIELANDGTSRTVRILDGDKVIDTKAGGDTFKDADHPDCVVAHEDLQLTYMQECPDVDKVRWRVTNPNDEAVDFDWDVYGTDIGGTATVDAKGTYFIELANDGTSRTVRILDGDKVIDTKAGGDTFKDADHPDCVVAHEDLQLTYMQECPDVDKVRWRVTNPNDEAVDFDWDVYGTDIGGTATVDAKGTYFIELANDGTSRTVRILDGDKVIDTKAGGDTFKDADHPDCVVGGTTPPGNGGTTPPGNGDIIVEQPTIVLPIVVEPVIPPVSTPPATTPPAVEVPVQPVEVMPVVVERPAPQPAVDRPAAQPTGDTAVLGVTHSQPQVAASTLPRTGIPVLAMLIAGLFSMLSGAALLRRRQ
jgi:LPXTG-motif cell wall-anchored protein